MTHFCALTSRLEVNLVILQTRLQSPPSDKTL